VTGRSGRSFGGDHLITGGKAMSQRAPRQPRSSRASRARAGAARRDPTGLASCRFLPLQFLGLLGKGSVADIRLGESVEQNMTILFADIRDFTTLSESLRAGETFRFINAYLKAMEPALVGSHGIIDKYIGDAIMALFPTGADDAVRGAVGMLERLRGFNAARRRSGVPAIRIGMGLNTGLAMAGAVGGAHRMQATVISDAVNLASRLETLTKVYGVPLLISEHVYNSLEDPSAHDIRFVDRVRIRGKEQPQSVYEVFDADSPALRAAKHRTACAFEEALAHYHFREVPQALRLLRRCLAQCPQDRVAKVYADRCTRFLESGVHEGTGEIEMAIVWGPEYRIGQAVIDAQHRELFAAVNEFARVVRGAKTGAQALRISAFLRRYVEEHFETEERVMREAGYPLLDVQQQQHARFARDFSKLEVELHETLTARRTFLLFRVQLLVVDWLAHHTMKADRHFGRFLAARGRRRRAGGRGR